MSMMCLWNLECVRTCRCDHEIDLLSTAVRQLHEAKNAYAATARFDYENEILTTSSVHIGQISAGNFCRNGLVFIR